jgi:hypothetical protein
LFDVENDFAVSNFVASRAARPLFPRHWGCAALVEDRNNPDPSKGAALRVILCGIREPPQDHCR